MTITSARPVDADVLREMIVNDGELALLDLRETGVFARSHLLHAVSLSLSRLELHIDALVPRRSVAVVLVAGAGDENLIETGARRLTNFGYTDILYLAGGVEAWAKAGFELFSGVNVPSKAFGEFVEAEYETPHITASELKVMQNRGDNVVILDSRPIKEFRKMSIPGGVNVPGAELAYRVYDIVPNPETTVVVNCAGRTRSIIGAQSLINARIPNPVVALENGTMGWHLAGLELDHDKEESFPEVSEAGLRYAAAAADVVAERFGVAQVSLETLDTWLLDENRTTYLLDVRNPAEYRAGHGPGFRSAPGGQLVQATDEYVGVRGARLVLVDDDGVRATMTASWLMQMGWDDVHVLIGGSASDGLVGGSLNAANLGLDDGDIEEVDVEQLADLLDRGQVVVADVAKSIYYQSGHIPGAWFAIRSRMPANLDKVPVAPLLVLTSKHGILARLAAVDATLSGRRIQVLAGGTDAWVEAGLSLESGFTHMADEPEDRWYKPYDLDEGNDKEMRKYLSWEVDLVSQIERDGTTRFRIFE